MSKIILITGSTDGIGKLAAIKLAKEGHQLYLHGRNAEKLDKVVEAIKTDSNNQHVKGYVADFSNLNAVEEMAQQIKNELPIIDVLVNNAGIFLSPQPLTKDGKDVRMVVNYLAPYMLTKALLPLLKKSTEPRIINLSSAAQSSVSIDLLKGQTEVSNQTAYAQSKLAILMWSYHLSKQAPEITTIALNPGSLLNTNMVREAYGKYWSPADKGAVIIYELAVTEKSKGMTGTYYDNDKGDFGKAHSDAYKEGRIKQLIEATEAIIEKA